MMLLQLQDKRCVFDNTDKVESSTIEPSIVEENENIDKKDIDNIDVISNNIEVKSNIENISQDEKIKEISRLQPKRKGNTLYTITSNIKTANGKYLVTKIIEESDEKKAKILYEKEVKKELGKPRNITKMTIKEYEVEDKENIVEIIDAPVLVEENEKKELSLFEQALEILCKSPYIHIFKIPSPKVGANKFHYEIYKDEEHLKNSLRETFDEIQEKIDKADFGVDELNREKRKEAEKIIGANERFYQRMVAGAKQLSEQDIRKDKNVIRYIGKQDDEWYKTIISIHEEEKDEDENRITIIKENIKKILDSDKINLYIMRLEEFDNSSILIAARTSDQANQIGMCSEHTLNLLKEGTSEKDLKKELNVNAQVMKLDDKSISKILENEDALNDLISRSTFTTDIITKRQFSLEKINKFLDKVDAVNNMTEQERKEAVNKLVKSRKLSDDFQERMNFISSMKITEKVNEIKGDA